MKTLIEALEFIKEIKVYDENIIIALGVKKLEDKLKKL